MFAVFALRVASVCFVSTEYITTVLLLPHLRWLLSCAWLIHKKIAFLFFLFLQQKDFLMTRVSRNS